MKWIFLIALILVFQVTSAQTATEFLTLGESYELLKQNYPLAEKAEIRRKIIELNSSLARSGWFPDFQVRADASYQSDVSEVPFAAPGTEAPQFSHDHYNLSVDVTQSLFDGGRTRSLINVEEYSGGAELAKIETELLEIRSHVDQVFFSILMMEKQEESLQLLLDDITEQSAVVQAQVRNGVLLPGDQLVLKAEQIQIEQKLVQVQADIRAACSVLSELLGIPVSIETNLELPGVSEWNETKEGNRPEYDLFNANRLAMESQKQLAGADKLPSVSIFGRTAYGRPGLNVFEDKLQFYWIVGIRAQWSFKSTRNASTKTEALKLQQRNLDADRDAFTRQLNASLRKAEHQIEALKVQIEQDAEVLELRTQIAAEKRSRLGEGSITPAEYITELNAENRARINLELRKIQRIQAITEYETKKGISWK